MLHSPIKNKLHDAFHEKIARENVRNFLFLEENWEIQADFIRYIFRVKVSI